MTTPEAQIDEFLKNTHSSNSARVANANILIPSGAIIRLKSIQFELEDRIKCNALPNDVKLAAINNQYMEIFCQQRSQTLEEEVQRQQVSLPDITVPKFDGRNYNDFIAQFNEVVNRTYGDHGRLMVLTCHLGQRGRRNSATVFPLLDPNIQQAENTLFIICPIY